MQEHPQHQHHTERPEDPMDAEINANVAKFTRPNVFVTTGIILQRHLEHIQKSLPEFKASQPEKHTMKELCDFLKKTEDGFTIAAVIGQMTEHPDGRSGVDTVRPLLASTDAQVQMAARAFMVQHGPADELPNHIAKLNDTLTATLKSEQQAMQQYRQKVAASMLRAKQTGKGEKAHMLLDNPTEDRLYFSQFTSLATGYGAALQRGQNVMPQLQQLLTTENPIGLVSAGMTLLKSGHYNEWRLLMKNGNETQKDGLALAMNLTILMLPKTDTEKRKSLQETIASVLNGNLPLSTAQRRILQTVAQ